MSAYAESPYPDMIHAFTHPGRLAAVASLMGLRPAPVQHWRVLDVGCAGGANLCAMAFTLPDASFVGFDLDPGHIEQAAAAVDGLGLANVTLRVADVMALDPAELGSFDLVIAHGFYSWVPPAVRDRLLALCGAVLAPQGIAMVSFNALPGWYRQQYVRDLMRFRTRHLEGSGAKVAAARAIMRLVAEGASPDVLVPAAAAEAAEPADPLADGVLLHDELGEINDPVYVYDFAQHAARHGLELLVEAHLCDSMTTSLPPHVVDAVSDLSDDPMEVEQYLDFVRNRTFRRAVLCRAGLAGSRNLKADRLLGLTLTARCDEIGTDAHGTATFQAVDGTLYETDHPLTAEVLRLASDAWPVSHPFPALVTAAARELGLELGPLDIERVLVSVVDAFGRSRHLAEVRADEPPAAPAAGERPVASPVARWFLGKHPVAITLTHDAFELDDDLRSLLPLLDGTRDRVALVAAGADADRLDEHLDRLAFFGLLLA
jgi:SAM-dependent methyltransferase